MVDVFRPKVQGRRSTYYYGKVRDPLTKKWRKVALGITDKGVARQKLRELQVRAEQAAYGMIDPVSETPLSEHLEKYLRHLEQQGCSETYRLQTFREIAKVTLHCSRQEVPERINREHIGAIRDHLAKVTLDTISVDKVDDFLSSLADDKAARTRNGYRTSIVGLFNFLVEKKKIPFNPMLAVTRHHGELKRKRRALPPDQLQKLLDAARARPLAQTLLIHRGARKGLAEATISLDVRRRREMDGAQRAVVYLAAVYTGLRRKELRALQVKHLRLQDEVPHIHLPGAFTKNGQDANIPLPPSLSEQLRRSTDGRQPGDCVFRIPRHDELLKALKKDLRFAGIPYRDELGRAFDFHSLRKCLGSYLRMAKVDPAASQLFMRHSDIRLTMETYDDAQLHDLHAEVVAKLPVFTLSQE